MKTSDFPMQAPVFMNLKQTPKTFTIQISGGLINDEPMTTDTLALSICHELGHLLGGGPKKMPDSARMGWLSAEGQADYYSTLKCFRKVIPVLSLSPADQAALAESEEQAIHKLCSNSECERTLRAADRLINALAARNGGGPVGLTTPSDVVVETTNAAAYPPFQCRLDTMVRGSFCDTGPDENLSDTDWNQGTCSEKNNSRPLCWYRGAFEAGK
jgi:hypothetical protein